MKALVCLLATALGVVSCVGTTGSDLVTFRAWASGPPDARVPLEFESGRGYRVSLTRARIHIGALYLNRSRPNSGAQETGCFLPGIYVAEVLAPLDVDVLSPTPQAFNQLGDGTADHAEAAEVWLTGGDVTRLDDSTPIVEVAGVATRGGATFPFEGRVTIGRNRSLGTPDSSQPGSNPICKQRIVSPIVVDITPKVGGALFVTIDPRAWFSNVDFARLEPTSTDPLLFRIPDDATDPVGRTLLTGVQANGGVYGFAWKNH